MKVEPAVRTALAVCSDVDVVYGAGDASVHALASVSLEVEPGERVALGRALAQRPKLLLCDEPTGHLDSDTAQRVLDLIDALQAEFGFALVLATHDADVAARLDRRVELEDGRVVTEQTL